MFRGLWKLTWLEIKIFMREPLGAFGPIVFPILALVVGRRLLGGGRIPSAAAASAFLRIGLPVFLAVLIALNGVVSLI